jgi:hypothetical protein
MKRRQLLLLPCAALLPVLAAHAEHGWKPFTEQPPVYLEGEVTMIIWSDPHPHLELVQREGARVPADLQRRALRPHRDRQRTAELLRRVALPLAGERIWRVELPSLPKITTLGLDRPKIGEVLGVVGFAGPRVTGSPTLQAEIHYTGTTGYPLRADPL